MEILTGKQFGAYQIVGPLGAGGMAAVYKAYQPGIDRYVALKVLPQHFAKDPQFLKRFEQEAKVLAKLQHPHILPIHDYGQSEDYTYIVMPFIESGDLADVLSEQKLPLTETARIISQVGDALDYAHSMGVIHRDIKPSNILIDKRGNCLLTDFGIAKMVEGSQGGPLTMTGGVMGTPSYMSPEQGMGKPLDGRSDIYALGVILYQMVTGQVPFKAETPMAVMIKHINDPLLPPRQFDVDISESLERVILKSLAKQPNDRFTKAGDMVASLKAAVEAPETLQVNQNQHTTPSLPRIDTPRKPLKRLNPTPAQAIPAKEKSNDSVSLILVGITGSLFVLGLIILAAWFLLRPTNTELTPTDQSIEAQAPAIESLDTPQATATSALTLPAAPTETPIPTATSTPAQTPTSVPVQVQNPPNASGDFPTPPDFAFEACSGLSSGAICEVQGPTGALSGTCTDFSQGLACVPEGGPPAPPQ